MFCQPLVSTRLDSQKTKTSCEDLLSLRSPLSRTPYLTAQRAHLHSGCIVFIVYVAEMIIFPLYSSNMNTSTHFIWPVKACGDAVMTVHHEHGRAWLSVCVRMYNVKLTLIVCMCVCRYVYQERMHNMCMKV